MICFACKGKLFRTGHLTSYSLCRLCLLEFMTSSTGVTLRGHRWVREIVRIRDQHTCQDCKKIWIKPARRFDVHHLNGFCGERSQKYDKVSTIDLLITLCHKCHLNRNEVRGKMSQGRYKQSMII